MTVEGANATEPAELSFLWLEITPKCNLECSHCYADSGPSRQLQGQMTLEDWEVVIRDAADLGCSQVQFIGGEPTLHPHLAHLIRYSSSCGYTFIEVFTNATVLNEQLLQTFKTHGVKLAISFYSDDPATHDAVTGRRGSFTRTVASIKRIVAQGLPVRAAIIEMDANKGHADRARILLNDLGVSDLKIDFQRGVGRGTHHIQSPDPMTQLCGECSKGKLCITSSRKIYPCVFSRFAEVGDVDHGVRNIVCSDRLLTFRANLNDYQTRRSAACNPTCSPCAPGTFIVCPPHGGGCQPSSSCNPTCNPCAP
jgi:MoaA/NifB/PqqE/SkfB family radical SAM enzyme